MPNQTTHHLVMVRPRTFAAGSPTVADNHFMKSVPEDREREVARLARDEFDGYLQVLRDAGLRITVLEDREDVPTPDSTFPNNWFTTHEDGLFVTYPLAWPARRLERRPDLLEILDKDHKITRTLALDHWEEDYRILEGTGSLVLDRENRIAYVCYSDRATPKAVRDWCAAMDYKPMGFSAVDQGGRAIYHTNVLMAVGTESAILCTESIADPEERKQVLDSLRKTGKQVVDITFDQMNNFAGNALEVMTSTGPAWVMSSTAFRALDQTQKAVLKFPILHAPLAVIERYGGGSARCMIAEVFLPEK